MTKKIKILIVDDSAVMRQMLKSILTTQPDFEVVGEAEDPYDAREKIKNLSPDVLTLDVEMPKMDGISFLEKLMNLRPMPVIMVSTLTGRGTETAIAALQLGALDCIEKPTATSDAALASFAVELQAMIRMASTANIRPRRQKVEHIAVTATQFKLGRNAPKLIAIGASTGGVEALTEALVHLPTNLPPIVIAQHMPPGFTASFARRLSTLCALRIEEGVDRMPLHSGMAVIAPGARQMEVVPIGDQWRCKITDGPPINNHKPSVDVLFNSVAEQVKEKALGVILTGMGRDGAHGLLNMRNAGAHTIGQDEASSIVYGMPRAAYELGAVAEVATLTAIADVIKERCSL